MQLQVWASFEKRRNSTRQPSGTPSAVLEVVMKKDTSMMNPSFIISGEPGTSLTTINYCAWNSRFYFVEDCIFLTNNQAELKCKVDVLATYKGDILEYEAYVVRASQLTRPWLPDPAVIPLQHKAYWGNTQANLSSGWDTSEGSYTIRVVGGGGTSGTGITSYCVNATGLNHIVEKAFSAANYDFLSADEAIKSFFNPFQYIVQVMWFPLTPATLGSDNFQHIKLGWWDLGESYRVVSATSVTLTCVLKRPTNLPEKFVSRDSRFTTVKVYLPGCGTYFLNPIDLSSDLHCIYNIDIATGECMVTLQNSDRKELIGSFTGSVGVPIAIGQLDMNLASSAKSLISGLGSGLSGNVGGLLNGVADAAINLAQPTPSVNGANGNRGAIQNMPNPTISWDSKASSGVAPAQRGNFVAETYKLSLIKGYVQCANASLDVHGTGYEKDQLNNFLNGGIFIE